MARFKAFLEGRKDGDPPRAFKLEKRATDVTVGIDGQGVGVVLHASVNPGDLTDRFRLYATHGGQGTMPVYLGTVHLERGILTFRTPLTHTKES